MQPSAYLILSNLPGENRLKNLQYLLGPGDNVLGSDPRCQIVLPASYQMLHYAANIRIGPNFATVQALQPHLVYVQANLGRLQPRDSKADNYFPLAQNVQYLPRLGEFFFVGRIKAVIGCGSRQELAQMRHVVNRQAFRLQPTALASLPAEGRPPARLSPVLPPQSQTQMHAQPPQYLTLQDPFVPKLQNVLRPPQFIQVQEEPGMQSAPSGDPKNQAGSQSQSNRSLTQRLDPEEYQLDPTLVLYDGIYANEPTVNLDQPPFLQKQDTPKQPPNQPNFPLDYSLKPEQEYQKKFKPFSQQALMNEIRMQQRSQRHQELEQDAQFSMPDTIVDKEPEQPVRAEPPKGHTFRQIESKEESPQEEVQEDEMPPTIQEAEPQKIKPAKTLAAKYSVEQYPARLYMSEHVNRKEVDQPLQPNDIQNFDDLFGIDEKPLKSLCVSLPALAEQPPNLSLMHVSSVGNQRPSAGCKQQNPKKMKANLIKAEPQLKHKNQQKESQSIEANSQNKVNMAGFKPTSAHKDYLKKQGLQIVANPTHDYSILLVKEPLRVCNKLLLALVCGKQIQNEQWIFNKQSEIQSKLNGLSWKQVYEKKGSHGQPLKGKGRFYISKRLEDLFEGVIEKLGGELAAELVDRKRVINVVLRPEDSLDTELYLTNRQNKKWRFVKSQLIVDCVLTGRYALQEKYLINMFNDDQ